MGDRQRRRDGAVKRVQLTSGDHGGKGGGGRAKGKPKRASSKAERKADAQRQVAVFRRNIRASEERRKARQGDDSAPAVEAQPRSTVDGGPASAEERLAYAYAVLLARVSVYGQAMDSGSWGPLEAEASKVAAAAAELEAATKMIMGAADTADGPPGS